MKVSLLLPLSLGVDEPLNLSLFTIVIYGFTKITPEYQEFLKASGQSIPFYQKKLE